MCGVVAGEESKGCCLSTNLANSFFHGTGSAGKILQNIVERLDRLLGMVSNCCPTPDCMTLGKLLTPSKL